MGISHESIPRQLSVGMQENTTTHELGKHDIYLFNACNAFSRTSDFSNTGDSLSLIWIIWKTSARCRLLMKRIERLSRYRGLLS